MKELYNVDNYQDWSNGLSVFFTIFIELYDCDNQPSSNLFLALVDQCFKNRQEVV